MSEQPKGGKPALVGSARPVVSEEMIERMRQYVAETAGRPIPSGRRSRR